MSDIKKELEREENKIWAWCKAQNLPKQVAIGAGFIIALIVLFNIIF